MSLFQRKNKQRYSSIVSSSGITVFNFFSGICIGILIGIQLQHLAELRSYNSHNSEKNCNCQSITPEHDIQKILSPNNLKDSKNKLIQLKEDNTLKGEEFVPLFKRKYTFQRAANPGWNNLHVYFGETTELETWGKMFFGQVKQDRRVINSVFNKKRNGYFIDLAANDPVVLSNTFRLEQIFNWTGLCIEANPYYWYRLAHRGRCTVVGALVGKENDVEVPIDFTTLEEGGISSAGKTKRKTVNLLTLFQKFDVPTTIDYMSLDVEGAEELIMESFPYSSYKFNCLTIERPSPKLVNILVSQNYHFMQNLSDWGETLWVHNSYLGEQNDDWFKSFPDYYPKLQKHRI